MKHGTQFFTRIQHLKKLINQISLLVSKDFIVLIVYIVCTSNRKQCNINCKVNLLV